LRRSFSACIRRRSFQFVDCDFFFDML
jgi:hypothetical protein